MGESPLPETPLPETPLPETPIPETPLPDTPLPETPLPETPMPETPIPETPIPETTIPETLQLFRITEWMAFLFCALQVTAVSLERSGQGRGSYTEEGYSARVTPVNPAGTLLGSVEPVRVDSNEGSKQRQGD